MRPIGGGGVDAARAASESDEFPKPAAERRSSFVLAEQKRQPSRGGGD